MHLNPQMSKYGDENAKVTL